MSNWTNEQLYAINAEGTGIIVSAAAGSGKTSVLVERLIRILSDAEKKVPADRIIVVTFTNAAAAQMKQRLSDAITAKMIEEPSNEWLCRQQTLLQTARISTIHSFCFDMIRENIGTLDVSSGFRILDEPEEAMIKRNAIGEAFEKFYSEKSDVMEKLCDVFNSSGRGDSELEETILDIYKYLVSIPFYNDRMKEWIKFYSDGFDPDKDPLAAYYLKYLEKKYDGYKKQAIYLNNTFKKYTKRDSKALLDDIDYFSTLINDLQTGKTWNDKVVQPDHKFLTFDSIKPPRESKKANPAAEKKETVFDKYPEFKDIQDKIMEIRKKYKDDMKSVKEEIFTKEDITDDYKKHSDILKDLLSLIECFEDEFRRLKNEKNALSFSDAEYYAVKLLAGKDEKGNIVRTPLADELSGYYSMIMIDEFQDANDNQDLIFKMLSKGGTAECGGKDLFTVGDVKQSIYRFRLANPKLFLDALGRSEPYDKAASRRTNTAVFLNKNFRSSNEVIDFVNYVFENLMSIEVGEVKYDSKEFLVPGREYSDPADTADIFFIPDAGSDASGDDTDDSGNDDEEDLYDDSEAMAAASMIASMIGKRTIGEGDDARPCEPKDFCILMRSGKDRSDVYVKALAAYGIKAHAEEPEGYLRSREISVLLSMLSVIDNPMQDLHLAAVLMSPMFMLNADDMAVLASLRSDREKYFMVIKNIINGKYDKSDNEPAADEKDENDKETPPPVDKQLKAKLSRFMKTFDKLRCCAVSQRLDRFIRTIYDSTDFLSSVQTYKDGDMKKANLRLLLDIAESYETNSGGGISGFIRYTDMLIRRGGDLQRASVVSSNENAVSVMTIHKSKGLEFPFVFLCGTSKKFNTRSLSNRVQINSGHGIGFKIQERETLKDYDSFPRMVLREMNRDDLLSEEMRLLYVALTRAKEQIFISVPDNEKVRRKIDNACTLVEIYGGVCPETASSADSMLEWLSSVMAVHKDGSLFRNGANLTINNSNVNVNVHEYEIKAPDAEKQDNSTVKADPSAVKYLEDVFAFSYYDERTSQSAKITVTEIAKSETGDKLFLRRPDFAAEKGGLTAAERGTAMHTFMQYADYPAAEKSILSEVERLYESGMISLEEKDSLNIAQLEEFFRSELYERMKKSDNIRREQKFLVKKSDTGLDDVRLMEYNKDSMLQGIADCMFEEDGEIVLVDYKTDKVTSPSVLVSRYDLQIKLYGAALSRIFGKRVKEAYLYSFSLGQAVRAPLGKAE